MSDTLKILHVIPSVSPLRGGPSFLLRSLACRLARAGLEVHVATTDDDGPGRMDMPLGVPVLEDGVRYWFFPRQTSFYTISIPLARWLSEMTGIFDLMHVHALFTFPSLPAAFWAVRREVPYLVRPLGTLNQWGVRNRRRWLKMISFPLLERRILEHAATVHFTSRSERDEANQLGFTAPSVVIPNAFDPEEVVGGRSERFWFRHRDLAGRKMALFLSRLDQKKGLDLLLGAFAALRGLEPLPVLVVAGSGPSELLARLRRLAETLGVADRVAFTGHLEGDEKRDALAAADLFVLPSRSENFGIAVVEAMAAGLPVVVSDQVAVHEEVTAAGAGFVVPCETGALTEALRQAFLEEKGTRGGRGKALCEERFSLESVTRQWTRLYQSVVERASGSGAILGSTADRRGGR